MRGIFGGLEEKGGGGLSGFEVLQLRVGGLRVDNVMEFFKSQELICED